MYSILPESFLSSRIPKLKFNFNPWFNIKRASVKIYTDCGIRYIAVYPIREALQQR